MSISRISTDKPRGGVPQAKLFMAGTWDACVSNIGAKFSHCACARENAPTAANCRVLDSASGRWVVFEAPQPFHRVGLAPGCS